MLRRNSQVDVGIHQIWGPCAGCYTPWCRDPSKVIHNMGKLEIPDSDQCTLCTWDAAGCHQDDFLVIGSGQKG